MSDTLGNFIKKNREKHNIPRSVLCRGICSRTTLMRYEDNIRTPDKFVADVLLERLGIYPYIYEFITSEQEFHYRQIRNRIDNFIRQKNYDLAAKEMDEYKKSISSVASSFLHMQYLLLKQIEIARLKQVDGQKIIHLLKKAISCTVESTMVEERFQDIYLSINEFQAIYWLADALKQIGEGETAKKYYKFLKKYLDSREWDFYKKEKYYPALLYQIAYFDYEDCNYGSASENLKEAKQLLIQNYSYVGLQKILQLEMCIHSHFPVLKEREKKENDDFYALLDIIANSEQGIITKEGVEYWENTANQRLSDIPEEQKE